MRPWQVVLREWQEQCFRKYRLHADPNFLIVATPGSGKTVAALRLAHWLLDTSQVKRVVIVVPSSHLRFQWYKAAAEVGIQLDPTWENKHGHETADFHGIVVTYQSVATRDAPELHALNCARSSTLVILDEIHHAGEGLAWGDALRTAFAPASRRLPLSGTPFRSDPNRIPFVCYDGMGTSRADFPYTYLDALRERTVIRHILFPNHDGEMEWLFNGVERSATFADELNDFEMSQRLRTALLPTGSWLREIIVEANDKLLELRQAGHSDAGGLILAMNQEHAGQIIRLMQDIANDPSLDAVAAAQLRNPALAVSDEKEASDRIASFRDDTRPWIVAVKMISEGVDIPRLRVGVYATNVITELFFRQVVGRFVRWIKGLAEQTSYLYIPFDERLIEFAYNVEQERNHFLKEEEEKEERERAESERKSSDFMPVDSSSPVSQGIIHSGTLLPPSEIEEAKALLGEDVSRLVPEHKLVAAARRVRERLSTFAPVPIPVPPKETREELSSHQDRTIQRDICQQRARDFVKQILRTKVRPDASKDELFKLVGRKLMEHTGAYVPDSTIVQLRQRGQLLLKWSKDLGLAFKAGQAAEWLRRWEEDQP